MRKISQSSCHASVAADDYTHTHKSSYGKNLLRQRGARNDQLSGTGSNHFGEQPKYNSIGIHEQNSVRNSNSNNAKYYQVPVKKPFDESQKYYGPKCTYCHKRSHTISKCWKLQQESGSKPVAVVGSNCGNTLLSSCHDSDAIYHSGDTPMCYDIPVLDVGSNCGNTLIPSCHGSNAMREDSNASLESYKAFISSGSVSLVGIPATRVCYAISIFQIINVDSGH